MKRDRLWLLLCAALLLAGIIGCFGMARQTSGRTVEILQDGTLLYTLDLDHAENQVFEVSYQGRSNTIQIQDGAICVLKAECPDQTCVHMDFLSDSGLPIVCLPNRLVIQFTDAAALDGSTN